MFTYLCLYYSSCATPIPSSGTLTGVVRPDRGDRGKEQLSGLHSNIWHLSENWENTAHVFEAPDSNKKVEQDRRELAASCSISDDEQGMEEEKEVGEKLSLPLYKY
jgi:hypothetical protein